MWMHLGVRNFTQAPQVFTQTGPRFQQSGLFLIQILADAHDEPRWYAWDEFPVSEWGVQCMWLSTREEISLARRPEFRLDRVGNRNSPRVDFGESHSTY